MREKPFLLAAKKKDAPWESTDKIESLIQRVGRGIARLIDAYSEGAIEKEEFDPRIRRARERLANLENDLEERREQLSKKEETQAAIGPVATENFVRAEA